VESGKRCNTGFPLRRRRRRRRRAAGRREAFHIHDRAQKEDPWEVEEDPTHVVSSTGPYARNASLY
jgi:hypothetical protein